MINAILACDVNGGIGKNGGLPWPHNSEDMKWFKDHTSNGAVVMGRKTWESLGSKPLKGRQNIVISRSPNPDPKSEVIFDSSLIGVLDELKDYKTFDIWIIGGGTIYEQALEFCDNVYLTKFKKSYDCDTFVDKELLKPFQKLKYSRDTEDCSFTIWSLL